MSINKVGFWLRKMSQVSLLYTTLHILLKAYVMNRDNEHLIQQFIPFHMHTLVQIVYQHCSFHRFEVCDYVCIYLS